MHAATVRTACACRKHLHETQWPETRDETYWAETETYCSETKTRPETHRSETEMKPRRWGFCQRWDRDETLVRLETETSQPRPHPCIFARQQKSVTFAFPSIKFVSSIERTKAKCFSFRRASPPDPLTMGSAPGPHYIFCCTQQLNIMVDIWPTLKNSLSLCPGPRPLVAPSFRLLAPPMVCMRAKETKISAAIQAWERIYVSYYCKAA